MDAAVRALRITCTAAIVVRIPSWNSPSAFFTSPASSAAQAFTLCGCERQRPQRTRQHRSEARTWAYGKRIGEKAIATHHSAPPKPPSTTAPPPPAAPFPPGDPAAAASLATAGLPATDRAVAAAAAGGRPALVAFGSFLRASRMEKARWNRSSTCVRRPEAVGGVGGAGWQDASGGVVRSFGGREPKPKWKGQWGLAGTGSKRRSQQRPNGVPFPAADLRLQQRLVGRR